MEDKLVNPLFNKRPYGCPVEQKSPVEQKTIVNHYYDSSSHESGSDKSRSDKSRSGGGGVLAGGGGLLSAAAGGGLPVGAGILTTVGAAVVMAGTLGPFLMSLSEDEDPTGGSSTIKRAVQGMTICVTIPIMSLAAGITGWAVGAMVVNGPTLAMVTTAFPAFAKLNLGFAAMFGGMTWLALRLDYDENRLYPETSDYKFNDCPSLSGWNDLTYRFDRNTGSKMIANYNQASANEDVVLIGEGVEAKDIWFNRVGNNLEVSILRSDDKEIIVGTEGEISTLQNDSKVTIRNWFLGDAYHIEKFQLADGKVLLNTDIDNLISSMAGFSPEAAGETYIDSQSQITLNAVIATTWK